MWLSFFVIQSEGSMRIADTEDRVSHTTKRSALLGTTQTKQRPQRQRNRPSGSSAWSWRLHPHPWASGNCTQSQSQFVHFMMCDWKQMFHVCCCHLASSLLQLHANGPITNRSGQQPQQQGLSWLALKDWLHTVYTVLYQHSHSQVCTRGVYFMGEALAFQSSLPLW